jgi:hypothetical protein
VAAVLGPFTVAELIQLGLGAPAAAKAIVDVVTEVKALNLRPEDAVPPAHAARVSDALAHLVSQRVYASARGAPLVPAAGYGEPEPNSPETFASGGLVP